MKQAENVLNKRLRILIMMMSMLLVFWCMPNRYLSKCLALAFSLSKSMPWDVCLPQLVVTCRAVVTWHLRRRAQLTRDSAAAWPAGIFRCDCGGDATAVPRLGNRRFYRSNAWCNCSFCATLLICYLFILIYLGNVRITCVNVNWLEESV